MSNLSSSGKSAVWLYSVIGSLYGIWMLYAGGITYLLISAVLYAPGTILYVIARKETGSKIFPETIDKIAFLLLAAMTAVSLYLLVSGRISI